MPHFLTTFLALLLLINSAYAQDAGKVITVVGKVSYKTSDGAAAQPLTSGKTLQVGWTINTEADGKAKLLLTDRTVIDLTPSTEFKVDQFKQNGKDTLNREVSLAVKVGKIRSSVNSPVSDKGKFLIKTKSTTMGVRGTEFIVNSMISNSGDKGVQNVNTQITVIHGKVAVSDLSNPNSKPIELTTGKQLVSEVRMNIATGSFVAPTGSSPASSGPKVVDVPKQELDQMKNETTVQDTTFKDTTNIEEKSKNEREAKKEEAEKKDSEGKKEAKEDSNGKSESAESKDPEKQSTEQAKADGEKSEGKEKSDNADKGSAEGGEKSTENSGDKGKEKEGGKSEQASNSNADSGGGEKQADGKGGPREPASEGGGSKDSAKSDAGGGKGPDKKGPPPSGGGAGGPPKMDSMANVLNSIGGAGPSTGGGPAIPLNIPPPKVDTRGTETVSAGTFFAPSAIPTQTINNGSVNVKVTFTP